MGPGLRKQLWAFERLIDPAALPEIKHHTNALEQALAAESPTPSRGRSTSTPATSPSPSSSWRRPRTRPTALYLRDGIFAEVTLHFRDGRFQPWPWTYADYRLPEVLAFLGEARAWYRQRLARPPSGETT